MAKPFLEVFPALKLEQELHGFMERTQVERISATKNKDFLRIYISSDRLILKDIVFAVEKEIKRQLFPTANMTVKIYEKFRLSSQYNLQKLYDVYKESILSEIREYSHVLHNILKKAEFGFPEENNLTLTLEDTVLAKSKAEDLQGILYKIFNERCGMSAVISITYKTAKEGRFREEDEKKIALQVAQISVRAKALRGDTPEESLPAAPVQSSSPSVHTDHTAKAKGEERPVSGKKADHAPAGNAGRTKFGFDRKKEFTRGVKRSNNPDVIYGRDVEEEPVKIEDIVGEMGEVVIRGRILNFDKREIKNEKTILFFDITDFTDTMTVKLFIHKEQKSFKAD